MCYDKSASLALFLKGEFTMSEKDEITVIGFCERASTSVKMGGIGSAIY